MDPVTLGIVSAGLAAAGTAVGAVTTSTAMKNQASADQQRADIEAAWADRRATDERAASQRQAGNKLREARFAQSRLTALAGGSGAGVTDATVMDLWGDIEKEGRLNAQNEQAAGEQKATGLEYQGDLDKWSADANARIKRSAATGTLIGGLLSAGGQLGSGFSKSRMATRYGGSDLGTSTGGTGYG